MKNFNNFVKKILLIENPFFVENQLPIDLNEKSINQKIVQTIIADGEKLNSFEGRDVYKIIVNQNYSYFCFIQNDIADAYVEFSADGDQIYNGTVAQKKSEDTKGFLRRAFLNYFSRIFPSVILDWKANILGKQFFKKLLKESNEKGFKTIIVDKRTKEEAPYNEENFEQYWSVGSYVNYPYDKHRGFRTFYALSF